MLGDKWIIDRDKWLHTLGNLTLTGYNTELGDKPFSKKKELIAEKQTKVVILYKDIKDKDSWNSTNIKLRAENLAKNVIKLFPIEEPEQKMTFTDTRYQLYTAEEPRTATHKSVNYYILLGERVNVSNFFELVKSVAQKLYEYNSSIIEKMALNNEVLPYYQKPTFSYDSSKLRKAVELIKDKGIYIAIAGVSAFDSISFIKSLLKKYELDIAEDFMYSAREVKKEEDKNNE